MCHDTYHIDTNMTSLFVNYGTMSHFVISFCQHNMHDTSTYDISTVTSFKPI
jgi:hypothetical protein